MIIQLEDLTKIRDAHPNQKIVLGSGTFDVFHAGHGLYIKKVVEQGDIVVVLVHSDARVKSAKGDHRPVFSEADRAEVVDNIKGVDYTLIVPGNGQRGQVDPMYVYIFHQLRPDIFVSSNSGWSMFPEITGDTELRLFKREPDSVSTSSIIERIASGVHSPKIMN